jgi:hypothetical protein
MRPFQKQKPPERSLSPAGKVASNLEFVAQCGLHYARLIEQRGIVAKGRPLIGVDLGRLNVEYRSPSEKSSAVHLKPNRKVCEFVSHGQDLQNLPS